MSINNIITEIPELPIIEVSYKKNRNNLETIKIHSSRDTYEVLKNIWDVNTIELYEEFKVIYLDRANGVLGLRNLTR